MFFKAMMMDRKWGANLTNLILLIFYLLIVWVFGVQTWWAAPEAVVIFVGCDHLFAWGRSHSMKKQIRYAQKLEDRDAQEMQITRILWHYTNYYRTMSEHLITLRPDIFGESPHDRIKIPGPDKEI